MPNGPPFSYLYGSWGSNERFCGVLTQDLESRKLPTRLSTLVEKLELGLKGLSRCADCVLLADDGVHVGFCHLCDDQGAEDLADLAD